MSSTVIRDAVLAQPGLEHVKVDDDVALLRRLVERIGVDRRERLARRQYEPVTTPQIAVGVGRNLRTTRRAIARLVDANKVVAADEFAFPPLWVAA